MNIYDKKQIKCANCNSFVGEVLYNAKIIYPLCGNCADPHSEVQDKIYGIMAKIVHKFSYN